MDNAADTHSGDDMLLSDDAPEGFTEVEPDIDVESDDLDESNQADADFGLLTEAQIDTATGELEAMPEIQPEQWQNLDSDERLATLQQIEERMAEIQGRPSVEIRTAALEAGSCGGYARGEGITVSDEHLASNDVEEVVDTILHEGRHAYQDFVIQNPDVPHGSSQGQSWCDNWDNYLTADDYGQEIYQQQPIEADAWAYAGRIRAQLYGRGDA